MVAVEHGWWWAWCWRVRESFGGSAHCGEGEEEGDCGEEKGEEERASMGMGLAWDVYGDEMSWWIVRWRSGMGRE